MKKNRNINSKLKKKILQRDDFTCQKCEFKDTTMKELEIHHIRPRVFSKDDNEENLIVLCSICHKYAPDNSEDLKGYLKDKIDR